MHRYQMHQNFSQLQYLTRGRTLTDPNMSFYIRNILYNFFVIMLYFDRDVFGLTTSVTMTISYLSITRDHAYIF